ncbi:MAG TPA: hypothetical protein GXZ87_02075 [Bacteroidales bacterium]|nr:hypothetical protein [Bacteroidales bacterium]
MKDNDINEILGIDNPQSNENTAYNSVSENGNEGFANALNIIGIVLYIVGVVAAIFIFTKISRLWGEYDEDLASTAFVISVLVLFYHIVSGLMCQGISKVLKNIR